MHYLGLNRIPPPPKSLNRDWIPIVNHKITAERFYQRINLFIDKNFIIISDTGDSLFGTADLILPEGVDYIGQAFYLSIGYSIPAALGVKMAVLEKRLIIFVGDGAFQMTGQEISTMIRHKLNLVIFLLNNDGYTTERVIRDEPYNDIHMWNYHSFPQVFNGGWGCEVTTEGELEEALKKIIALPDSLALIEVKLDRWDCSVGLQKLGEAFHRKKKKN